MSSFYFPCSIYSFDDFRLCFPKNTSKVNNLAKFERYKNEERWNWPLNCSYRVYYYNMDERPFYEQIEQYILLYEPI